MPFLLITSLLPYPIDPHAQHLAPGSALTPASDHASLPTTSHISPMWTSPTLPSPGAGSSNAPTVIVHPPRLMSFPSLHFYFHALIFFFLPAVSSFMLLGISLYQPNDNSRPLSNLASRAPPDPSSVLPCLASSVSSLPTQSWSVYLLQTPQERRRRPASPANTKSESRSSVHPWHLDPVRASDEMPFSSWRERVQALQIWQARLYRRRPKTQECPNKRKYLLPQMKQQDELIDSLVKQAYRNATSSNDQHQQNVIAWLDRLQSSVRSPARSAPAAHLFHLDTHAVKVAGQSDESDEEPASQERAQQPPPSSGPEDVPVSPNALVESDIDTYPDDAVPIGLRAKFAISTSHRLVMPDDMEKFFYTRIDYLESQPFISLHEPKVHTPILTFSRCPFLFLVVCAISSCYSEKREAYSIAMHFAKTAAANELIDGRKSVELCQAYILLSIYAVPARRWEEDRSWLYTGLAIRSVTDLNLHILPPKKLTMEQQELEMLNRTQIWIICFNIDKSTATQFGKPSIIVRKSLKWYKSSLNNHPIRPLTCVSFALQLHQLREAGHVHFWFQNAFQRGLETDDEVFFTRSLESAKPAVTVLVDGPNRLHMFCTRCIEISYFVFGAFASAFMLKLLCTECSRFITPGLETEVYQVIERLIATIGSPQIATDERHTPNLYSRFLASLLAKHKRDGTAQGRMPQQGPPPQQMQTGSSTPRYQQPPQPPQPQPPQQQQQRPQEQLALPPQNTTSSSLSSGVSGNAGTPDLHQSVLQNSGATALPNFMNAVSTEGRGNYVLEQPPDFMFGVAGQPGELMDFTFDTITTPGNDDVLATMQAIQNPTWWQNMMMPGSADACLYIISTRFGLTVNTRGFFWPVEEVVQDHTNTIGNGMNTYQNLQQPAEGLRG
ncbi:hypothetical protein F5148DRAFT_1153666 [Russula earlei]|uniref:Uncharacterized protein n=1 Tax=Russula earlei TaxID=71964 RepID=A0ACC0TUQ2_9AGAM|nr:hypothetical protein F5148DRAFT_1153666 [Russula earlei]